MANMNDVAKKAGVSRGTVSNYINNVKIKESSKQKTIVLVSHRVSTMNIADTVYEMKDGRIS